MEFIPAVEEDWLTLSNSDNDEGDDEEEEDDDNDDDNEDDDNDDILKWYFEVMCLCSNAGS